MHANAGQVPVRAIWARADKNDIELEAGLQELVLDLFRDYIEADIRAYSDSLDFCGRRVQTGKLLAAMEDGGFPRTATRLCFHKLCLLRFAGTAQQKTKREKRTAVYALGKRHVLYKCTTINLITT